MFELFGKTYRIVFPWERGEPTHYHEHIHTTIDTDRHVVSTGCGPIQPYNRMSLECYRPPVVCDPRSPMQQVVPPSQPPVVITNIYPPACGVPHRVPRCDEPQSPPPRRGCESRGHLDEFEKQVQQTESVILNVTVVGTYRPDVADLFGLPDPASPPITTAVPVPGSGVALQFHVELSREMLIKLRAGVRTSSDCNVQTFFDDPKVRRRQANGPKVSIGLSPDADANILAIVATDAYEHNSLFALRAMGYDEMIYLRSGAGDFAVLPATMANPYPNIAVPLEENNPSGAVAAIRLQKALYSLAENMLRQKASMDIGRERRTFKKEIEKKAQRHCFYGDDRSGPRRHDHHSREEDDCSSLRSLNSMSSMSTMSLMSSFRR